MRRNLLMPRDEKSRKQTFVKRKPTLKKKASELATLCDVSVCMICYGLDGELDTWPEDRNVVREIAKRYKEVAGIDKVRKQNLDLRRFLEKKMEKSTQLEAKKKSTTNNKAVELEKFPTWDERLDDFSEEKLTDLVGFLDSKLQILKERRRLLTEIDTNRSDQGKEIQGFDHRDDQSPLMINATDLWPTTTDYGAMMFDYPDNQAVETDLFGLGTSMPESDDHDSGHQENSETDLFGFNNNDDVLLYDIINGPFGFFYGQ